VRPTTLLDAKQGNLYLNLHSYNLHVVDQIAPYMVARSWDAASSLSSDFQQTSSRPPADGSRQRRLQGSNIICLMQCALVTVFHGFNSVRACAELGV